MLAGKEPKLLQETVDFVMKRHRSDSGMHASPLVSPSSSYPPPTMSLLGGSFKSTMHSLDRDPMITPRREDQRQYKSAIAELYCACNRNMSFGDLWITLTTDLPASTTLATPSLHRSQGANTSATSQHRRSVARKGEVGEGEVEPDAFREQMDSLALSPMETNHFETLRKTSSQNSVDWNDVFEWFDHRRFTSFGLVHGLLVRVHNYPYFPGSFPEANTRTFDSNAARAEAKQKLKSEEKSHELAHKVASLMDGVRCDDQLACMFERPFSELVDLVEQFSGKKIISVYAAAPGY
jgi:hypothetical protein